MPTEKLNLPTITGNLAIDVQRDLNALAQAVDEKAGATNGLATLNQEGKVPGTQLDISAPPDATTTTKGIVKLNDSTDSASTTEASTANAVRKVSERVTTHLADDTSHVRYGAATAANAKLISLNPAPTSLVEGFALSFKNATQNSSAVTLNVNGLGAKPVLKANGTALASGNLKANSIYTVRFNGASFILQGEGGSGNAVASDLLSGKTASTDAGDITGAMPNNGVFNLGLGVPVPAGYYSGGTTAGGKKWASGTGTASVGILTISVLSFRPSYIQVSYGDSDVSHTSTYSSFHGYPFNNYGFRIGSYSGNNQLMTGVSWTTDGSGFTYKHSNASSYGPIRWIAYE